MKIMVADNDHELVDMLSYWLKKHHYEVVRAFDSEQTIKNWRGTSPDLVIIDVEMLKRIGIETYRQMRSETHSAVLLLTAYEPGSDEIQNLEIESEKFLHKPFNPRQLLVLIKAILHRSPNMENPSRSSTVTVGTITLDALRHEVLREGKKVRLTPTESRLLHVLMTHSGQILPIGMILECIRGYEPVQETGLVKTHIRHLRQKVERDAGNPEYIMTVLGVGYTFTAPFLARK